MEEEDVAVVIGWRDAVAAIDVATALLSGLNFGYFARRFTAVAPELLPRRVAAAVLAVVALGTLVESAALVVIGAEGEAPALAAGSWALVRVLTLAGTLGISVLIARRMMGG
jgi:hypothetical protein